MLKKTLPPCNNKFDVLHLTKRIYLSSVVKNGLIPMQEGREDLSHDESGIYTISFKGYDKKTCDILSNLLLNDFGYSGGFDSIPSLKKDVKNEFVGIGIRNIGKMNVTHQGRERYIINERINPKDLCLINDITSLFSTADISAFKNEL